MPGLTRPELAVLAAWTKIELAAALRASPCPTIPALESYLLGYFPGACAPSFPMRSARTACGARSSSSSW